jgi:hypothetical protein
MQQIAFLSLIAHPPKRTEQHPDVAFYLRKNSVDVHIIPFLRNLDNRNFINHIFVKQNPDYLLGGIERSSFAAPDQQVVFGHNHYITPFERRARIIMTGLIIRH